MRNDDDQCETMMIPDVFLMSTHLVCNVWYNYSVSKYILFMQEFKVFTECKSESIFVINLLVYSLTHCLFEDCIILHSANLTRNLKVTVLCYI